MHMSIDVPVLRLASLAFIEIYLMKNNLLFSGTTFHLFIKEKQSLVRETILIKYRFQMLFTLDYFDLIE